MVVTAPSAALLGPRDAFPSAWQHSLAQPSVLQCNKLDLARAQLFLEGQRRAALLLLISQRLSDAIILRWLCGVSSRRVGGCEPHGSCSAAPWAVPWRAAAVRSREHDPWGETCRGRKRRGTGLRWPLWHLTAVWLPISTCLPFP